jgi:tRNA(Arg) A34 adenosine deaminase TadA
VTSTGADLTDDDRRHLRRCVALAQVAVEGGNPPFGSVLVVDGEVVAEDHNRSAGGDRTQHPEFALARWAAEHLDPAVRADARVYTSGEHCPMCAAAHAYVGLGPIVFATSAEQTAAWLADLGVAPSPVRTLPITEVTPGAVVLGPVAELAGQVRELHRRHHRPQA